LIPDLGMRRENQSAAIGMLGITTRYARSQRVIRGACDATSIATANKSKSAMNPTTSIMPRTYILGEP